MNEKIMLDYYQGAYGPTIHIEVYSIADLKIIKHWINSVRANKINEISFKSLKNVVVTGFSNLVLKKSSGKHENSVKVDNTSEGKVFIWIQTDDALEDCEFLIDGLIESNSSGHQYLIENEILVIELYLKL